MSTISKTGTVCSQCQHRVVQIINNDTHTLASVPSLDCCTCRNLLSKEFQLFMSGHNEKAENINSDIAAHLSVSAVKMEDILTAVYQEHKLSSDELQGYVKRKAVNISVAISPQLQSLTHTNHLCVSLKEAVKTYIQDIVLNLHISSEKENTVDTYIHNACTDEDCFLKLKITADTYKEMRSSHQGLKRKKHGAHTHIQGPTLPDTCTSPNGLQFRLEDSYAVISGIYISRPPILITGRYLKFSRDVCQTPSNAIPEAVGADMQLRNVQGYIYEAFKTFIPCKEIRFHAAGREDVDVRMLGNGRPFVCVFDEPQICVSAALTHCTQKSECLDTYIHIHPQSVCAHAYVSSECVWSALSGCVSATSEGRVCVCNLNCNCGWSVCADKLSQVQTDAEQHRKTYVCVVWTHTHVSKEILDVLRETQTPLLIHQRTPTRVMHRRPIITRERHIYSLAVVAISANCFTLQLDAEAGTYIKEFVHSDMGRTYPSVTSLLSRPCEILQLDVLCLKD